MTQEGRNWRALCSAIANEQDSANLAELVQDLLVVLDAEDALTKTPKTNRFIAMTAEGN
jgi:hypothetical protein